jgi:CxxC-x17-CxxC domain-containing protein
MKNFKGGAGNRGGGFRGGNSAGGKLPFQKKSWGGDRGDRAGAGETVMHKATCSNCRKPCEVPFRPTNGKPVFCRDCFNTNRETDNRNARGDSRDNRGVSRSDFARPSFTPAPATNDNSRQLAEISSKLDRLVNSMERMLKTTSTKDESTESESRSVASETKEPKVSKKKTPKAKK